MPTTLFRTASGTNYLFDHDTRVLSSERPQEVSSVDGEPLTLINIVVEVVAVEGFDITEGERAVIIGKHPTDPQGADGRGTWSLNTSPVVWVSSYTNA